MFNSNSTTSNPATNPVSFDMIIPVPLGRARQEIRGYNQAALLAYPLSQYFSIPYYPNLLQRTRETHSQVGLNAEHRRAIVPEELLDVEMDFRERELITVVKSH